MKYLVDSDVLIDHIRGKKLLSEEVVSEGLGMSIISLGELLHGVYKSNNPEKSLEKINKIFNLGVVVENLNHEIMDIYAKLKVELEKAGQKLDEFDLLIGATAKISNLILITRNLNHFKRIKDLKLKD